MGHDTSPAFGDGNGPENALITGASKRIGAAMARHLAEHGTNVAIHHHDSAEEAEELCSTLQAFGVKALPLKADLARPGETRKLLAEAVAALGPIDLVINNASIFEPDSVEELDEELWETHFAIHVRAPSVLAGEMAKQAVVNEGLVVNMIDQRVWRLTPGFYSYTLSKSALWTATKTMAQALAPRIRVNGIGPGPTLPNERQSETDFQAQVDALLLKRPPALEEFGKTVSWLWQAKSVTGQMIALDGGQHLAWETPDVTGINE